MYGFAIAKFNMRKSRQTTLRLPFAIRGSRTSIVQQLLHGIMNPVDLEHHVSFTYLFVCYASLCTKFRNTTTTRKRSVQPAIQSQPLKFQYASNCQPCWRQLTVSARALYEVLSESMPGGGGCFLPRQQCVPCRIQIVASFGRATTTGAYRTRS